MVSFLFFTLCVSQVTSFRWPRRFRSVQSNNKNHNNSDDENNNNPLSSLQLDPLLQVPCSLQLVPNTGDNQVPRPQHAIGTFCDTGAQRTCMSWDCVQRLGLAHLMDHRYAGQATGVGFCRVLGRIPAHTVLLQFASQLDGRQVTIMAPPITVLEKSTLDEVDLLLGLDFLRETQAVIDLKDEFLQLTCVMEITSDGTGTRKRDNNNNNQPKIIRIPFIRPRSSLSMGDDDSDAYAKAKEFVVSEIPRYLQKDGDNDEETDSDSDLLEDGTMDMRGM
ncbi:DNA damage-inducible protein 1 [Seminavis robusta]|uniref:DNA damage-inducible protein 1 n=1 Tax=Seminavis robusta TaxID=568900 RepID=A0A9N8EU44_9STRA|nr:DNA damage-inducible protein 1 [Seminavis robusta]|eukprot:Sro1695_g291730.1 DNA damage-inducible protein 1 (277) ;mRNA; r:4738-5568